MVAHVLEVFERCPSVHGVILVVVPKSEEYCKGEIVDKYGFKKVANIIPGGEERQDSVFCGLKALQEAEIVAVHDAVRPFLPLRLLEETIRSAARWGAAAPALPLADTVKSVDGEGFSTGTADRQRLRVVQTPQVFSYRILLDSMKSAFKEGFRGTDETSVVERAGYRVKLIEGSPLNIKVTTPDDWALAEAILSQNPPERP